jgi:negative regulator of flagellin synthesis FlgM
MRIGKPTELQQTDARTRAGGTGAVGGVAGTRSEPVEKTPGVDAVRLSQTSRSLATERVAEEEPVRSKKVEEIKAAIREGRFQVSAHAVADKMISQAAELLETLSRAK